MSGQVCTRPGPRPFAVPFVVAPPAGVRTRTRLRPTGPEERLLERVGEHLGCMYRQTLASRVRLGWTTSTAQAAWRTQVKRELTSQASSRWAGAITRTAIDSYHLGMRGLVAETTMLRAAAATITARMAVPVGERDETTRVRGYANEVERFQKSRRLAALRDRLTEAEARLQAGRPRIVAGGGRLWRARHHLEAAELTVPQWGQQWRDRRMFLIADGESGAKHGNETIRVTPDGVVTVKIPTALVEEFGVTHLTFTTPVPMATHRGQERRERVSANLSVRYDIHRDERGRWYLDASWRSGVQHVASLAVLQQQRTLGVDLNAGHVDAAVIDASGNVVGVPQRLDVKLEGGSISARDAQVRHAVTRLTHLAQQHGCASITIEDLGFTDARTTGRETMGRGARGKRFRRAVAGIPTAKFRNRLVGMAATVGLAVISVGPAYSSIWAKQHWLTPLQASDPTVDGHRAAAVVIGRRGLGHRARRKPVGPRTRQRTRAGQPISQPNPVRALEGSAAHRPRAHDAAGSRGRPESGDRRQHRPDGTVQRPHQRSLNRNGYAGLAADSSVHHRWSTMTAG